MKRTFAALRFTEDENIADKTYWYACDFMAREGEQVLAPVGAHNRLQRAVIERICEAEERAAPYDIKLIKRVAAKYGARKFPLNCVRNCRELGGVKIGEKRYSKFGAYLNCDFPAFMGEEDAELLTDYGVTALIDFREESAKQANERAGEYFSVLSYPVTDHGAAADCGKEAETRINERTREDKSELYPVTDHGTAVDCEKEAEMRINEHAREVISLQSYFKNTAIDYERLAQSAGMRGALKACARAEGCVLFGGGAGTEATGVLSALLLSAAGASAQTVLREFLLSARSAGEAQVNAREKAFSRFLKTVVCAGSANYLRGLGLDEWEINKIQLKLTGCSAGR